MSQVAACIMKCSRFQIRELLVSSPAAFSDFCGLVQFMNSSALLALSPLDGRYNAQAQVVSTYFSEFSLIRYRIRVEIEYLILFSELGLPECPELPDSLKEDLRAWYSAFSLDEALAVKEIEKSINHDVKAVEYLIRKKLHEIGAADWTEFVHFGLTSQDVNNTAIPLSLKECHVEVVLPGIQRIVAWLEEKGEEWLDVPMLARTHGQPASPVRFGKEMLVFAERINRQLELLNGIPFMAKFGGATGGFNAHHVAYPEVDWAAFGARFVNHLGLERARYTTQIEHYDCLSAYFDALSRINTILIDFCRDIWQYISLDYLKQHVKAGEVGSSAMPHKVNPIDFENAEGNLGLANAVFHHFSSKLPISRLQRDLSDSTVLRNIGVPLGHSVVAWNSVFRGLHKVSVNEEAMRSDLMEHPEIITEAIQTLLRRIGYPNPYEALKSLSRSGHKLRPSDLERFVNSLEIPEEVKAEIRQLSPLSYIGIRNF